MKKTLSILLAVLLVLALLCACGGGGEENTPPDENPSGESGEEQSPPEEGAAPEAALVNLSIAGDPLLAQAEVELQDLNENGYYDLDDVFVRLHELYYQDGAEGYASYVGDYGKAISRLWGDESGAYGYYVNHMSAMSLDDPVETGDIVGAFIYADTETWSDAYCWFEADGQEAGTGDTLVLTLYEAGFDENWNSIELPCVGAELLLNGEATGIFTDENGAAELIFTQPGSYVLSAASEAENLVPPVCVMEITGDPVEGSSALWLMEHVPASAAGSSEADWTAVALAGSEEETGAWLAEYLTAAGEYAARLDGVLSESRYTEYARLVMAVVSCGGDPEDLAGYDILSPLRDFERVTAQGVNGAIWAVIALDMAGDESGCTQAYAAYIGERSLPEGGFALSGTAADPDVTASAARALARVPGYEAAAALAAGELGRMQRPDGGYMSYGSANPQSVSQVLLAARELGAERCGLDLSSAVGALLRYRTEEGAFAAKEGGEASIMATQQALLALEGLEW